MNIAIEKKIEELYDEKCSAEVFQKWFRVNLIHYNESVQIIFKINYCPMCGRKLGGNNER